MASRVSTRSWSPVSGSTSQRSPTFGSSSSRGSRTSTAITSWRPASCSSGLRQSKRAAEVGDDDHERALPRQRARAQERLAERRRAARLGVLVHAKRPQQADQPAASLARRLGPRVGSPERDDPEPVAAPRRDVADRERDAFRDVCLAPIGRAELHRRRRVEHEPRHHHALGELHPHVRLSRARGHVPVELARIVARRVRPDLRELRARAEQHRAVVAGEQPLDATPDRDVERAQQRVRHRAGPRAIRRGLCAKGAEDRHAAVIRPRSSWGSGTVASTLSRMLSAVTPSASAWYVSTRRCRSASLVSACTSSTSA